jgi:hypothetical protein
MGRGRTTTGMVAASLIATIEAGKTDVADRVDDEEEGEEWDESMGMEAEETQYLNGMF